MAEAQMTLDAEALRAFFQISANFRLAREHAGPARIRGEGERIDMGLHVAGTTGVVVVAPGAADRLGLFGDDEIGHAGLPQADRHAEARKAGADDGDIGIDGRGCVGRRVVGGHHACVHPIRLLLFALNCYIG